MDRPTSKSAIAKRLLGNCASQRAGHESDTLGRVDVGIWADIDHRNLVVDPV